MKAKTLSPKTAKAGAAKNEAAASLSLPRRATFRQVGGSLMFAVPSEVVSLLSLRSGSQAELQVKGNTLVIVPRTRPVYTLDELLEGLPDERPLTDEDRAWLDAPPVGRELI